MWETRLQEDINHSIFRYSKGLWQHKQRSAEEGVGLEGKKWGCRYDGNGQGIKVVSWVDSYVFDDYKEVKKDK